MACRARAYHDSDGGVGVSAQIIRDLSDVDYHGDHSHLSSSGARTILDSPARFAWVRDNPPAPTTAFNLGHAVHTEVLGAGGPNVIGEWDSYRTVAAREWRDNAYATGMTPLLEAEAVVVRQAAEAVHRHPLASALLSAGEPEVSLFATDPDTGVKIKARPDWNRPGYLVDLKTTADANPAKFGKTAAAYGYHIQAAWYLHTARLVGLADEDTKFLFVLMEKAAPYLTSVVELDAPALSAGTKQMRRALDLYATCTETGQWPGYPEDAPLVGLPTWYYKQIDEDEL